MICPKFTYLNIQNEVHPCINNNCHRSISLDIEEFIADEFYDKLEWPAILGIKTKIECLKK